MDFITIEAEDTNSSDSSQCEEEEDKDDSALGTFIDDSNGNDEPDNISHVQLLHSQRSQDFEIIPKRVAGHYTRKRRRTRSPHGESDIIRCQHGGHGDPKKTVQVLSHSPPKTIRQYFTSGDTNRPHKDTSEGCTGSGATHTTRVITAQVHVPAEPTYTAGGNSPARTPLRQIDPNGRPPGRVTPVSPPVPHRRRNVSAGGTHYGENGARLPPPYETASETRQTEGQKLLQRCLVSKNKTLTALAVFKELYTASFTEVTRTFKSDKTQSYEWVFMVLGCSHIALEAVKDVLIHNTEHVILDIDPYKHLGVYYVGFTVSKSREGLLRFLKQHNIFTENVVLSNPPNKRSVLSALFFDKLVQVSGDKPQWMIDIITSGDKGGEGFELSKMIQWALDNNMYDEGAIAYNYALLADTDLNAQLWLKHNSQAKYVRDAATMCRHYRRGQMQAIGVMEHLATRMREYADSDIEEGWKRIIVFLRYQHVDHHTFINDLKYWIVNRPKRSTIAIVGIPDSGKSMFGMSLIQFLDGRVLSFSNHKSHFWLQPLSETRYALVDDVTWPAWDYMDVYMRNALDGNPICIDCKHRAPIQTKCPPLLLTSNYDPRERGTGAENSYRYLLSRITFMSFNRSIPCIGGQPRFLISPADWRSFMLKFRKELDINLTDLDYGGATGEPGETAEERG
ncbi:E1 [Psittacus erithacus papillomavirus 1]|uniref:Replication protein E1 n=2 Tax=Psittacus erithacus timneh papillomavirus TaxID=197772 RepID=Q8JJG5_PEPVA|nr:E1 [Psittacus erithacus papillomavirus 1]AAM46854.1 E1 [Psittacus erithacus papillomavirus 1]AAM75202.1 putative replication protein E1 [Thetapapillomavirus 1]